MNRGLFCCCFFFWKRSHNTHYSATYLFLFSPLNTRHFFPRQHFKLKFIILKNSTFSQQVCHQSPGGEKATCKSKMGKEKTHIDPVVNSHMESGRSTAAGPLMGHRGETDERATENVGREAAEAGEAPPSTPGSWTN